MFVFSDDYNNGDNNKYKLLRFEHQFQLLSKVSQSKLKHINCLSQINSIQVIQFLKSIIKEQYNQIWVQSPILSEKKILFLNTGTTFVIENHTKWTEGNV